MISEVFIRRPITAIVISLIILIIGILSIISLPISQYPNISPPTVNVTANYTGADALTVEQTVTTPVELQINGTPGMSFLSSTSTSDGRMNTTVTFDVGTDINIAALDVQNRVSVATPTLPEPVRRLGITVRKRNPTLLMVVAIYSPKGTHDAEFLDNYTNIYLKNAILRVPGVGDVNTRAEDFSMRIWLNPDKLAQLNMTPADVAAAINEQNIQVAGGAIGAAPQPTTQAFEYSLLLNARLEDEEQYKNIIVRTNPEDGSKVYLRDIARIELGKFNYGGAVKVNGEQAALLLVYQTPDGNALETADGIEATLKELKKSFPPDVDYNVSFESVSVVRVSIEEVLHTLVEALLLVTLVVFLFLQSWRATLIPILAIPVSIIGTFIFFIPLGFTINTLTMFGFVLAIGIVVDDAIVVVEAVQHYIDHERLSAKEATRRAMKDITAPVIAIALILAAVFVPVGFIPGIVGRLYQQFAITIAVSVIISAFIALTLTPALCSLLLKPMNLNEESRGLNRFFFKFNAWFSRTTEKYSNGVRFFIRKAPLAIILLICIYVGTIGMFASKPTGFVPNEDEGRLFIAVTLPEGASSTRTSAVIDKMIVIIKEKFPAVKNATSIAGLNVLNFSVKSNSGTVFTQLQPWDKRTNKDDRLEGLMANMRKEFATIKEANIVVVSPPAVPGLGTTGGFTFVLQQKTAGSAKELEEVAGKFVGAINKRPEIANAYSFYNARTPGYQVLVDREKAKKMGVSLSAAYGVISNYLGSIYINDFTKYGRNFRVVAQADTAFRMNVESIKNYYVKNDKGEAVPLSAIINYKVVENAAMLAHFNLFRSADINGGAAPGYSSGDALAALEEVAAQVLPAGYGYEFSGLSREEKKSSGTTGAIFALSIGFVFLLLAALYESWSVPFSILLSVPIGAFGAILALIFLPSLSNNIYAQIGLITLIGLTAKNAILIVEFAKERVDWGMEVVAATIEAVKLRLRPIIMTSMAFILGILPLVFSSGAGAIARQTIGWTVFGGMLAATFLAIFIVPVLFVLITRLAYGKTKLAELQANYKPEDHKDTLHV
jgi:HAE1 family hydrophobic/amphiphilic exporter-1